MDRYPITLLHRHDARFPAELVSTTGAPKQLYVRGSIDALHSAHRLAVVGTRQMTEYGTLVTERIVRPTAAREIVIVSGLALGIDAAAHRACLDAGGTTIAVLGSGIDDASISPRTNLRLAHDILSHGGALVSEYAPGVSADRWTFPARNRIISGLSAAVLIIEADIKSGALITARLAADQGRDVLAVPGSLFWPRSLGPNMLIQNGAKAVTSVTDILEVFGLSDDVRKPSERIPVSTLNPVQARIAAILENGPADADTMAVTTDTTAAQIMSELTRMEINGLVIRGNDGRFRIS